jgi:NH3-dependent NAD+ synthetase
MLKKIIENIKKNKIVVILSGVIAALITALFVVIGLRPRKIKENKVIKDTITEGEGTDEVISDINGNIDNINSNVNNSKNRVF